MAEIRSPIFWKSFDYATLVFELGFLPAVLHKRSFQFFCGVAVLFHLGAWLIFNIAYVNNLLVYLLFIRWNAVLAFLNRTGWWRLAEKAHGNTKFFWLVFLFLATIYALLYLAYPEQILRDKLYGPLSLVGIAGDWNFRDVRGPALLTGAVVVFLWQLRLKE